MKRLFLITTAYRCTVRYQNADGSVAVVTGVFDRSQGPGDTVCCFRATLAVKVLSVTVEELATASSQEFAQ